MEAYRRIDALRGEESRSAWIQSLIDREEKRRERQRFIESMREHYTEAVCRKTLQINEEFPVHDP